jgi:hypothetical protein
MNKNVRLAMAFLGQVCFLGGVATANTITLTAIQSGTYSSTGANNATNQTYVAGNCSDPVCSTSGVYRDFFVFDLSSLPADIEITDATMTLENPYRLGLFNGGYSSPNQLVSGNPGGPDDTYAVFGVASGGIAALRTSHPAGAAGTAIYNSLGSGTSYGSYVLTKPLNTKGENSVVIVFNDAGVSALNDALDPFGTSLFAVGGAFQDLPPRRTQAQEYIFQKSTAKDIRQLTITYTADAPVGAPAAVPEPATLGLTGVALIVAGLISVARKFEP